MNRREFLASVAGAAVVAAIPTQVAAAVVPATTTISASGPHGYVITQVMVWASAAGFYELSANGIRQLSMPIDKGGCYTWNATPGDNIHAPLGVTLTGQSIERYHLAWVEE